MLKEDHAGGEREAEDLHRDGGPHNYDMQRAWQKRVKTQDGNRKFGLPSGSIGGKESLTGLKRWSSGRALSQPPPNVDTKSVGPGRGGSKPRSACEADSK